MAKTSKDADWGVTCTRVGKYTYWYVHPDAVRHRVASREEGIEARKKHDAQKMEAKRLGVNLKTKVCAFRNFRELADWFLNVPKVKRKKSYGRACDAVTHLMNYFGKLTIDKITPARMEDYRDHRREKGRAETTIDLEISYLSNMFNLALKRKKITMALMPG